MEKHTSSQVNSAAEDPENEDIAQMLHQLNQPLTAIGNYAQTGSYMLENGLPDPQQLKELFSKISAQSERCVQLSRKLRTAIDDDSTKP